MSECSPLHIVVGPVSHSIVGVTLLLGVGPGGIFQIALEPALVPTTHQVLAQHLVSSVTDKTGSFTVQFW